MPSRRLAAVATVLSLALAGCAATVVHPPADVGDPVTVVIADYGRHSSLVLPRHDATSVEYAYGEWRWFAAGDNALWRAPGVVFGSSPGALGRRELGAIDPDPAALRAVLGVESVHEVEVERGLALVLVRSLDEAFAAGGDKAVFNAENGLTFVPDARDYSSEHHCNTAVARWLGELGCEVGPAGMIANFRVEPARATRTNEGQ